MFMTSPSLIDFRVHAVRTGSDDAGRVDFHRMLSALVGVTHPNATDVRPDPGDWGIDVLVGSLVDSVMIWQSKYFYTEIGDSQKRQIRESFKSAMKHATDNSYTVESWTLCVACELSAPERLWWDRKVREWRSDYPNMSFDLWDAPRLRRMLMSPDTKHVFDEFYGAFAGNAADQPVEPRERGDIPVSMERTPDYDGALFVKQMTVAGIGTADAQRTAYFNADLVARDVAARAISDELAAVREIDASVLGHWEDAVVDPATEPNSTEYQTSAKRLFAAVMNRIQQVQAPAALPVRQLHVRGFMHKVVDDGRAGWVHDWKEVAELHDSQPASRLSAESSGSESAGEVEEFV
jgi:hypothetical protein